MIRRMGVIFRQKLEKRKIPVFNIFFLICTGLLIVLSIWGPEMLAKYQERKILSQVHVETVAIMGEGYRYALNSQEKLYILSEALSSYLTRNQTIPQEQQQLTGSYAFIVNHRGPSEKQITNEEVYDRWNQELAHLKSLGILPEVVIEADKEAYTAVFYSAIDVLEPRNNVAVWRLTLSDIQKNISWQNKLIEAYIDGDDGKIYEFYVRTEWEWEDIDTDAMITAWSEYMGLSEPVAYETANPLLEATPYFKKYAFSESSEEQTIVTIGFFEGINELFLKVSR